MGNLMGFAFMGLKPRVSGEGFGTQVTLERQFSSRTRVNPELAVRSGRKREGFIDGGLIEGCKSPPEVLVDLYLIIVAPSQAARKLCIFAAFNHILFQEVCPIPITFM